MSLHKLCQEISNLLGVSVVPKRINGKIRFETDGHLYQCELSIDENDDPDLMLFLEVIVSELQAERRMIYAKR